MNNNDLDNYKMPKLGREIARFFVNIARAVCVCNSGKVSEYATHLRAFMRRNYLAPIFMIALVLAVPWFMLLIEVGGSLYEQVRAPIETNPDAKRAQFYAIGLTVTGIGALLAPPFVLIKAWVNERQATTSEQGHITDRMTKAIEQLGAEKTVHKDGQLTTEPNLEVRLGAIYALERIAQDSERDHIPIMETLCAYIRQNTNSGPAQEFVLEDWLEEHRGTKAPPSLDEREAARTKWLDSLRPVLPPRDDVGTALTVLERRSALRKAHEKAASPAFRINIARANLQRADLSRSYLANADAHQSRLEGANLFDANWEGANFWRAELEGVILARANLSGANFRLAKLEGVDLRDAKMTGANLSGTEAEGANLRRANLQGADLMDANLAAAQFKDANLEGADITGAYMVGAKLAGANMANANLKRAKLEGADLRRVNMKGASLWETRLENADLRRANLAGADLRRAKSEEANLWEACLRGADLQYWACARSNCRSADFSDAKNMTQDQVNSMFGDAKTILPNNVRKPDHWDEAPLKPTFDDDKYADWIKRGAPPGEPVKE